jgi:transcriptional regulator with XRE-family HTH domain
MTKAHQPIEHLGQAVRKLRLEREWQQEDLARQLGCSSEEVSMVETGKRRNMRLDTISKWARPFGLSAADLIQMIDITPATQEVTPV